MATSTLYPYQLKQITQFTDVRPLIVGYQTSTDGIVGSVYLDNNSNNPITNVSTGTNTQFNSNFPRAAKKYQLTVDFNNVIGGAPHVPYQTTWSRINFASTTTGSKVSVRWNILSAKNANGYLKVVIKSQVASQAVAVTLRSSAGNEDTYTINASATTDVWTNVITRLGSIAEGGDGTRTGSPDYSNITEIEFKGTATGAASVDIAYLEAVESELSYIGSVIMLSIKCLASGGYEAQQNLQNANLMCNLLVESITPTGRDISYKFTTNDRSLYMSTLATGDVIRQGLITYYVPYAGPGLALSFTIGTNGTVTLPTNLTLGIIDINGAQLSPATSANEAAISGNKYFYAPSTGLLTVNASSFAGTVPLIYQAFSRNAAYQLMKGVRTGFVGAAQITRITDNVNEVNIFDRVQLSLGEEANGDAVDTISYGVTPLAVNGIYGKRSVF